MTHLSRLIALESLELADVPLRDEDLPRLTGLLNLQRLSLHGTAITNAGLSRYLASCTAWRN